MDEDKPLSAAIAAMKEQAAPADSLIDEPAPTSEQTDVKQSVADEADDKGVSYKNRFMEAERKLKKLEEKLKEVETKTAPTQSTDDDADALLEGETLRGSAQVQSSSDPQPAFQPFLDVDVDDDRPLTAKEVQLLMQSTMAKRSNDALAFARFPDLRNPNSELRKEVERRLALKKAAGIKVQQDPSIVYETTAAAFGEMVASGRLKPGVATSDESARRAAVDGSRTPATRTTQPPAAAAKDLTESQKAVLSRFNNLGANVTEDAYKKFRG